MEHQRSLLLTKFSYIIRQFFGFSLRNKKINLQDMVLFDTLHTPAGFAGDTAGTIHTTGKAGIHQQHNDTQNVPFKYNNYRQYSWTPSSDFQKLLRTLWKYTQSFEDELYHIYYKKSVNEETLRDFSSAIQEIIPRMAKVQSVLNNNSRGFPDMMRWTPPESEPLPTKTTIKDGAQECQEFAVMARQAAHKDGPISGLIAGGIIQNALACQAAASKAAVALQRANFGDPVCDPKTVIAGYTSMAAVGVICSCTNQQRFLNFSAFL